MIAPRKNFWGAPGIFLAGFLLQRLVSPIWDVEVQDFWKDKAHPILKNKVSGWLVAAVEWLGPFWGGVALTLLVTFTLEIIFARRRAEAFKPTSEDKPPVGKRALLRLRFSGEHEPPQAVSQENILNWFTYWTPGGKMEDEGGRRLLEIPSSWAIFVTFERPVNYQQLIASFTGNRPHSYQVRQALSTSAVITVEGGMPACEMELITRS